MGVLPVESPTMCAVAKTVIESGKVTDFANAFLSSPKMENNNGVTLYTTKD